MKGNKEISFILSGHKKQKGNRYLGLCILCDERCFGTGKQFDGWETKEYQTIGKVKIIAGECLRLMFDAFDKTLEELHQSRVN